jgi:outer membrane biosynthesis protein TonB
MEHPYLALLRNTRPPIVEKGVQIIIECPNMAESEAVPIHRQQIEIVDMTNKMKIDRERIIQRLREQKALAVQPKKIVERRVSEVGIVAVPMQNVVEPIVKTQKTIVIEDKPEKDVVEEEPAEEEDATEVLIIKKPQPKKEEPEEPEEKEEKEEPEKEEEPEPQKEEPEEKDEKPEEPKQEEPPALVKGKTVAIKRPRGTAKKQKDLEGVEGTNIKLTATLVKNRLPAYEKISMRTSPFYMNNRRMYIQKIREMFQPYSAEIEKNSDQITCATNNNIDFTLLTHQKIVRDYLNLYTPYRGLLLYHGLGSGKSCTSIAIAEGMKTAKNIILMTPASLKTNFFSELKKCGDHIYKKNQFWEFISTVGNASNAKLLSQALGLPLEKIENAKGAWFVDSSKPSNFATLNTSDQEAIDEQLDTMIRVKYKDINYNGLNKNILNSLTDDGRINPFDNKVVIIDEAHNFISRIVNKLKSKKPTISTKLYDYLMKANNARVVLLSGTPIINYPNEIAILYNILRGSIKTWSLPVVASSNKKVDRDVILELFAKNNITAYDYVNYSDNTITITRNPYGFVNKSKGETKAKSGGKSKRETKKVRTAKGSKGTKKYRQQLHEEEDASLLPVKLKDGMIIQIQKPNVSEEDMEQYNNDLETQIRHIHKGGQQGGQKSVHENIIHGGEGEFENYTGVKLDATGNISDTDFIKSITKVLNDNNIKVVEGSVKLTHNKALPDDKDVFLNTFVDLDSSVLKNEGIFKRRILGLTSYFRSAQEKLLPSFEMDGDKTYHLVKVPMSEHQFGEYIKIRKEEIDREQKAKKHQMMNAGKNDDVYKISSSYRIFSRAACNFTFPNGIPRPKPEGGEDELEADNEDEEANEKKLLSVDGTSPKLVTEVDEYADEEDAELLSQSVGEQTTYNQRIQAAMNALTNDKTNEIPNHYLLKESLKELSPKFLKILENLNDPDNRGLHLLYSQFRTIEGIGILKLILEANGYAEFKIKATAGAESWELVENIEDAGKPRFVLYTGTETAEEKEIIRNIYNSAWTDVPKSIVEKIQKISSNNHYGEVIKLMMITSSGAEGINLRNTRYVHIVEPYWHSVRLEQVIGRARRICSHQDLPEELRTLKVFIYITMFSEAQRKEHKNSAIMLKDSSRITPDYSVTTDESLYEIAEIKHNINQTILKCVKETAIDCSIHKNSENLVCYGSSMGKVKSNQFISYPTLEETSGELEEANVKAVKVKLTELKDPIREGVSYAFDKKTREIYDLTKYKRGELVLVGKVVEVKIPGKAKMGFEIVLNKA